MIPVLKLLVQFVNRFIFTLYFYINLCILIITFNYANLSFETFSKCINTSSTPSSSWISASESLTQTTWSLTCPSPSYGPVLPMHVSCTCSPSTVFSDNFWKVSLILCFLVSRCLLKWLHLSNLTSQTTQRNALICQYLRGSVLHAWNQKQFDAVFEAFIN